MQRDPKPVLVTGATGYVGGRLVPLLLDRGYAVRALGRSRRKLEDRLWARHPRVDLAVGDVLDLPSLRRATEGTCAAYYLVHSMAAKGPHFAEADRKAARNMAEAAADTNLDRVIYLSGLGCEDPDLSPHLRSRCEVADILRAGRVPCTVLNAAMIIGSGSASFEILRYLVERLPVMVTPKWVDTPLQPIAIRNALEYLVGCLEGDAVKGETFDIGGPSVLTYRDLMQIFQEEAKLPRRVVLPVPVLTPKLSSYWIHLVTPVPATLARPLTEGLRNPVVCRDTRIRGRIPQELLSPREAIRLALDPAQHEDLESHWTDAGAPPPVEWSLTGDPRWSGGTVLEDARDVTVQAEPEAAWTPIVKIGGETGWYYADWLWRARGTLDKLVGGVGLRRGRRHPRRLGVGDALDFWRVVDVHPPRRLVLAAEMKLPGEAILSFELTPVHGGTRIRQRAKFLPRGLWGILYWYGVYPLHALVFRGMLKSIAEAIERRDGGGDRARPGASPDAPP